MKLHTIDFLILVTYLLITIGLGMYMYRKARTSKEEYLLGGKKLPWYLLGLSDASEMFDISGTMWMVSLCFVYGMKSVWIPWLWPVFNQVFLMVYLSRWLRRSNATSGAEWLATRFGKTGKAVGFSHTIVVVFALLSCLGFLAYGFVGLGKFIEIFVPWSNIQPYIPFEPNPQYVPHLYGLLFTIFAVFYSVLGGMSSIVWGDVIKYIIVTIASIGVAIVAMHELSIHQLIVPENWYNPFFSGSLDLDWSNINREASEKINSDGYSLFGAFVMMALFKGYFASLAGPAPNYDMQKILSTKSPEEASKMSGFVSIILLPIRYSLIIGLTILGLIHFSELNLTTATGKVDFELILPQVINSYIPVGLLGLILTGLLAAFMGTFAGTLNAAQTYIVNDIYLKYVNPNANNRKIASMSYLSGITVVLVSMLMGFFAKDINTVLQWIVAALYGGYIASNVLKWYWWRFNANGFAWGMTAGVVSSLIFPMLFDGMLLWYFPLLFAISLIGCFIGTYTAPPTDIQILKQFYTTVRPWGFWKPIHAEVLKENPNFKANQDFSKDMFNIVLGIIGQICLTLLPMFFVLSQHFSLIIDILILGVIMFIMKRTWWDKLSPLKETSEETEKNWTTVVDVTHKFY